jgi:hypothetical protein
MLVTSDAREPARRSTGLPVDLELRDLGAAWRRRTVERANDPFGGSRNACIRGDPALPVVR